MSYRFWTFLIRALDTKFTYGIEDGEVCEVLNFVDIISKM